MTIRRWLIVALLLFYGGRVAAMLDAQNLVWPEKPLPG